MFTRVVQDGVGVAFPMVLIFGCYCPAIFAAEHAERFDERLMIEILSGDVGDQVRIA